MDNLCVEGSVDFPPLPPPNKWPDLHHVWFLSVWLMSLMILPLTFNIFCNIQATQYSLYCLSNIAIALWRTVIHFVILASWGSLGSQAYSMAPLWLKWASSVKTFLFRQYQGLHFSLHFCFSNNKAEDKCVISVDIFLTLPFVYFVASLEPWDNSAITFKQMC